MVKNLLLCIVAAALLTLCTTPATAATTRTQPDSRALPIFFIHGLGANAQAGSNLEANFTAEGRLFTSLDFCQDLCSLQALNQQVPLAIAQIRNITASDSRYDNGYAIVGMSLGGAIARGVVEEMDDHRARVLVSLAGGVNGLFYGPQPSDLTPTSLFASTLGPFVLSPDVFNFTKYSPMDFTGKLQRDYSERVANRVDLQAQYSLANIFRSPYFDEWVRTNSYFPRINNVNVCAKADARCQLDKKRRRRNFLRVREAHFFASPADEAVSPWQASHLAQYSEVASSEAIETEFTSLKVLDVKQTREYVQDTYGLQTLDRCGGLFFHTAENVSHECWLKDTTNARTQEPCKYQPVFSKVLLPVFQRPAFFASASGGTSVN